MIDKGLSIAAQVADEKREFVEKELQTLCKRLYFGLVSMVYTCDLQVAHGRETLLNEVVTATFDNGHEVAVNVNMDSLKALSRDVLKNLR